MDTLKGLADVVQQLLYETLGLLLPGVVAVIAVTAAVDPVGLQKLLTFGQQHVILSIAGAYVAGYVLQGISRPVVQLSDDMLAAIPALVLRGVGARVRGQLERMERHLTGRHAHRIEEASASAPDVEALVASIWKDRLGLTGEQRLRPEHLRDLSFSSMLGTRSQLDRFRASVSLCRGVATATSLVLALLTVQIATGTRSPNWTLAGALEMLVIVFYALMERADMYDRLWRNIIPMQFLAAATSPHGIPPIAKPHAAVQPSAAPPTNSPNTPSRSSHA